MPQDWKFSAVKTVSGNVLLDWLGGDGKLQARMDSYLRRLKVLNPPWPYPLFNPLKDGVGEIRFDLKNIEHRIYGYFGSGREFIAILASSDKKSQKRDIKAAKKLRAFYQLNPPRTEIYEVV